MNSKLLQSILLLRSAVDLGAAACFFAVPAASASAALHQTGYYAAGDGLLALALAAALRSHDDNDSSSGKAVRWLFGLALIDALMRVAVGGLIFAYPNVESRVLSAVVFFSAMIVVCIAVGLYGLVYVAVGRRADPARREGPAWFAGIASGCTLLFGLALIAGLSTDHGRRLLVASHALIFGLTFLAAGIRLNARPRPPSRSRA